MNREFLLNVLLLLGINLLIKPFYLFGIDRVVQNTLEPGLYGLYFTLFGFAYLFQVLNDFGLANFNSRQVAQHRHLIRKYFPSLLLLKGILLVAYLVALITLGWIWSYVPQYGYLLAVIGLNAGLLGLLLFLRSNLSGLGLYRRDSLFSALDRLILIAVVGTMLWVPSLRAQFQLWWFVLAHTFALSISCILVFLSFRSRIGPIRFRWQPARLLYFLKKSAPFALVIFLMTAYTRLDAIMLERLLNDGLAQVDRYAAAFRLLDAANALTFLFASLLLPMFSRQLQQRNPVAPLAGMGIRLLWMGATSLAILCWFFGEEIMAALYPGASAYDGQLLAWLMIAFIGMAGTYVYGTLITAAGMLFRLNLFFILGVVVNISLNLWLIPRSAALGAAQATAFTQLLLFLIQLWQAKKYVDLPVSWSLILRLGLFTAGFLGLSLLFYEYSNLSWTVKIVLLIVVAPIWALSLQLIRPSDWQLIPASHQMKT